MPTIRGWCNKAPAGVVPRAGCAGELALAGAIAAEAFCCVSAAAGSTNDAHNRHEIVKFFMDGLPVALVQEGICARLVPWRAEQCERRQPCQPQRGNSACKCMYLDAFTPSAGPRSITSDRADSAAGVQA